MPLKNGTSLWSKFKSHLNLFPWILTQKFSASLNCFCVARNRSDKEFGNKQMILIFGGQNLQQLLLFPARITNIVYTLVLNFNVGKPFASVNINFPAILRGV